MKRTRAINVRHDLAHGELGLGTVANREEGIPSVQKWLGDDGNEGSRIHQVDTGLETAADNEDHAAAVLLRRLPDIHGQGHSEFPPHRQHRVRAPVRKRGSAPASTISQDGKSRRSNLNHDTHFLNAAELLMHAVAVVQAHLNLLAAGLG